MFSQLPVQAGYWDGIDYDDGATKKRGEKLIDYLRDS
jgi:hypothetical protein